MESRDIPNLLCDLGEILNLSVPQSPLLQNGGGSNSYFMSLFLGLINVKRLGTGSEAAYLSSCY